MLGGFFIVVVTSLARLLAVEAILEAVVDGAVPEVAAWETEDAVDAGIGETFSGVFESYLTVDVFMAIGFPVILFIV